MNRSVNRMRAGRVVLAVFLSWLGLPVVAADRQPLAVAVFDFEVDRPELKTTGKEMAALLIAGLSTSPDLILIERQRLGDVLKEFELSHSGIVDPDAAARIGRLIGAKALVTGHAFQSGDNLIVVARTIGTETGRVYAETVTLAADEPTSTLAAMLAEKLSSRLTRSGDTLVAPPAPQENRMRDLAQLVQGKTLPTLSVSILERQGGRSGFDPAAETEITRILGSLGFRLLDPRSAAPPEIQITGEALSEVGSRFGNLVSASGRVEVKAVDRATRRVVVADRQTELAVDLSGAMAGKKALQQASETLSERLVRALVRER